MPAHEVAVSLFSWLTPIRHYRVSLAFRTYMIGIGLLSSLSPAIASSSGPCGDVPILTPNGIQLVKTDCSVTVKTLPSIGGRKEQVDILRPVVLISPFAYQSIRFTAGDHVTIDAGGCVQTGRSGKSWLRYVNPSGDGSDHLYFGSMEIPGVLAKTRFSALVGQTIAIENATTAVLVLYYEDNDYSDNGYYDHDSGPDNQCAGADGGPAHVTLTIANSLNQPPPDPNPSPTFPAPPSLPWDLTSSQSGLDDNGFPLNARWLWQIPRAEPPPFVSSGNRAVLATVSSQITGTDYAPVASIVDSDCFHVNWFDVTYTGTLQWDGHDPHLPSGDDDYNIRIFGPRVSGTACTIADLPQKVECMAGAAGLQPDNTWNIKGEFDSDETIDWFDRSNWWHSFHKAVDDDGTNTRGQDTRAGKMIDGHEGVMTGLMGFDMAHGGKTELHPVHALAIRIKDSINTSDDGWAMFARNWGNEGFCGTDQHYVRRGWSDSSKPPDTSISIVLPVPFVFEGQLLTPTVTPDTRLFMGTTSGDRERFPDVKDVVVRPLSPRYIVVSFPLAAPNEKTFVFGELHLDWGYYIRVRPALSRAVPAEKRGGAISLPDVVTVEPEGSEESEKLRAVLAGLSPTQQNAIISRMAAALPPRPADVSVPIPVRSSSQVVSPAPPNQLVSSGPDEAHNESRQIALAAICGVSAGITPAIPKLCIGANKVHIEAQRFATQSGPQSPGGGVSIVANGITDVDAGDWVQYRDVNFGDGSVDAFVAFMATPNSGGRVVAHLDTLDGRNIATLTTQANGKNASDFSSFAEQQSTADRVVGVHDVFIAFDGRQQIGAFEWFAFRQTGGTGVVPPNLSVLLPANVTIAPGQSMILPITLSAPAGPGGVTLTLTSGDPSVVNVTPNVTIPGGATAFDRNGPILTAVKFGQTTISVAAAGYATARGTVRVTIGMTFYPQNIAMVGTSIQARPILALSSPAPPEGLTIALNSENTKVATVPANVFIPAGELTVAVPVTPTGVGATTIRASVSPFVSDATVNVTVAPTGQ